MFPSGNLFPETFQLIYISFYPEQLVFLCTHTQTNSHTHTHAHTLGTRATSPGNGIVLSPFRQSTMEEGEHVELHYPLGLPV